MAKQSRDDIPQFHKRCYQLLIKVPKGKVTTYGDIARALGGQGFRAVGRAMNQNPFAPKVPCHRVVCSDGQLGGFASGSQKKRKLLKEEGVQVIKGRIAQFERVRYRFKK